MRTLNRELKDDAINENLLTEELESEERDAMEREDELTQQLVDELDRPLRDETVAHGGRRQQAACALLAVWAPHGGRACSRITAHNLAAVLLEPLWKMD